LHKKKKGTSDKTRPFRGKGFPGFPQQDCPLRQQGKELTVRKGAFLMRGRSRGHAERRNVPGDLDDLLVRFNSFREKVLLGSPKTQTTLLGLNRTTLKRKALFE